MNLRIATCSIAISAAFAAAPLTAAAAPTVAFKAPTSGGTLSGYLYQSSACEVTGSNIDRVRFYLDSTALNTEENSPWNCSLDTRKFADGTHTLKAVAYDWNGASAATQVSVNIKNSTTSSGPAVSFKQPTSGATLSGNIYQSSACEVTGSGFSKIVFALDGTALNTELSAPYLCNLDTRKFADGAHTLKATAYSSTGATSVAQVGVTIKNGTTSGGTSSGGLAITSPAAGATLSGSTNPCAASAPSGTTYVRFYRDGSWLNTDAGSPYTCNIDASRLSTGTHKLKAISYNGTNAITGQAEISFNVGTSSGGDTSSGSAPMVSFKAPASGATLSGTINQSSACEVAGSNIAKVQFYLDSTALNTELSSPWLCNLDTTKFANGTHTLMARAYNSSGASATSQVSVSIKNGTSTTPPPDGTSAISSADIVNQAQAEEQFSQQAGYNTQALNQYLYVTSIPESGMHYSTLKNGETIRLGKYPDPRNSTRKALVFQLDPNDPNTSGSKRAEIKFPNNIEMNKVYWTAFSIYVYDWGTLSTSDDALFGLQQHNGSPIDLSPNFALITSGTGRTFQVMALGSSSTSPSYSNTVTKKYAETPIPFGRWADFVFKFKLNTSGDGFLQVWMDGTQIVDHRGLLGYITPGYKDFFKFGYYNWSGSNFASTRKVLLRSPVIVADPTGSKYRPEDLRAFVNAR